MELRHLRYFIVVAQEKNFTRAAELLGIKQPPLSQQIRALETELGFALFLRHTKGAELTPGGVVFLHEARAVLAGVEHGMARAARVAHGIEGTLSIGLTSSAAAHPLVPATIRKYRAGWPGIALAFSEGNAAELTEALVGKKLDIG